MVDRPWYAGGAPAPPPPLMAHLTCLGWCRLCRQGARGWWLLETGVSGWWSMTLVGDSGMISEWFTDPDKLVVRHPPPLRWRRLCHQCARGWRLLETGVSGWWSMTLVGGSGMISEWLTDPGMLVVRLPSSQYATGAKALVKKIDGCEGTGQKIGRNPTMAPAAKV